MALQSSGPISLADIAAEFGGSAPHSLSEYYGVASGVPASGAIDIGDFYGKSNAINVTLNGSTTNILASNVVTTAGGNVYNFTVDATVTCHIYMWGGGGDSGGSGAGGGGAAYGRYTFQPGNTYKFAIGQGGYTNSNRVNATYLSGGDNGPMTNRGGGGYTGIFLGSISQGNAILMAGGGGGGGHVSYGSGGAGGGSNGQNGANFTQFTQSGGGGSQSGGGYASPYNNAQAGGALYGGHGMTVNQQYECGGGGGGYFGGGGGNAGGGGGGSGRIGSGIAGGALYTGNNTTPGNSGNGYRGSSGNVDTHGRITLVYHS